MRMYAKIEEKPVAVLEGGVSVVLGRRLQGAGIGSVRNGQLVCTFKDKPAPWLVPGASGKGKSESLLSIQYQLACNSDWSLFYLDAKGDQETAERHLALQRSAGRNPCVFPFTRFDGFRGDWKAVANRLMQIVEYSTKDGAAFYRSVALRVVQAACRMGSEPPRSSTELLDRLRRVTLPQISGEASKADVEQEKSLIQQVCLRYEAFFEQIGTVLDGDLAWEDADWFFLLDSVGEEEDAASLASFLTIDFGQYIKDACRKPRGHNCSLVIDEFSAVAERSKVSKLVEQARSYGALLLLAPQTEVGMGPAPQPSRILGSTEVTLVHGMKEPARIAALAGERECLALTQNFADGRATGGGYVTTEVVPRLPVDRVIGLEPGEVWVIRGNKVMKVAMQMAPRIFEPLPTPEVAESPWVQRLMTPMGRATYMSVKRKVSRNG
jgi:hypothetical protein